MIEIFKCREGLSPAVINEMLRLGNVLYTIRNPSDLDSQLPKTV